MLITGCIQSLRWTVDTKINDAIKYMWWAKTKHFVRHISLINFIWCDISASFINSTASMHEIYLKIVSTESFLHHKCWGDLRFETKSLFQFYLKRFINPKLLRTFKQTFEMNKWLWLNAIAGRLSSHFRCVYTRTSHIFCAYCQWTSFILHKVWPACALCTIQLLFNLLTHVGESGAIFQVYPSAEFDQLTIINEIQLNSFNSVKKYGEFIN